MIEALAAAWNSGSSELKLPAQVQTWKLGTVRLKQLAVPLNYCSVVIPVQNSKLILRYHNSTDLSRQAFLQR